MRPECHGVVRYFKSLLPVPQFGYSADELFGLDGTETFEKVWAMEILSIHMQAPETRVDVNEEIDIICPSWIAEKFVSQLLPHTTRRRVANGVVDFPTPVKACAWLEDMEMYSRVVVREIEAHIQDLPDTCRFNESIHQDILQTYFNFSTEFECFKLESCIKQQVQYTIEPGPYAIPLARDRACKEENSVLQTLRSDVVFNTENAKSVHQTSVKVFEIKPSDQDSLMEECSGQIGYKQLEEYTKTIDIQNLVGRVEQSKGEEPITKLIDFDPADFLLEKLHIRGNIVQHILQSASYEVGGLSFLDENSVAADRSIVTRHAAMKHTIKVMFELPEVLEDEYLDSFLTWELGTYVSTLMEPNPIELEDLDSQKIAFQDLEKLVIFPELTLETPRFHFLQVPSFISEHQARIPEDVFQVLFRPKALPSSTSASDWVYLDWHLSQVGHCNNYGCFHLQRRLMENELGLTLQRDMILGKRMPDHLLLVSLAEESLLWHHVETECGNKAYPTAYLHASAPTPPLNFSRFLHTAPKAADKSLSDQLALTHELKKKICSTRDQIPLPGSGSTSMDTVLSLMKQARQGDLSTETKLMQVSENDFYREGYQGIGNIKYKVNDQTLEEYQVLESALTAVKVFTSTPPPSSYIDAAISYNLQSLDHVEPELQVHLYTPACPSKELPETRIEPAPPMQPVNEELSTRQSEVGDFIQLSSGQGQGPHLIVVANILQPSGSIFLQRRSSYQKILGLENEDLQVVERELKLPVDLILNPSTCLTVYTKDKLLKCAKSHNPSSQEFFSCVMDMIVDSHMKALSFSFQRWFMIFEGELAFDSAIVHILDKLYACSAGFQMRVQGFLSTNPTATDSLVLRCIKKIWKMSKRPFDSSMSEDVTDSQAFLATFPSLNPLSSHVILCLNVTIATFISWSHEEQKCALQDFNVRAESLNLLAAQVLYGQLETSAHQGLFSECPWPAASEIVAPEVERPVQASFSYFPPASEISGCKFAEDSTGVLPREEHGDLNSPSCPDPIAPYDSAELGFSAWNGVCWPNDDETATFAHHANDRTQQPTFLQENYVCHNPADVHGILQQWIRRRKGGDRDMHHTEADSQFFWDSFKVPNHGLYRARPACVSELPTTSNAPSPSYKNHGNEELRWTPLLKTSDKRPISALEQFRHQRGVTPALRSHNKKLKPAIPSNRSRDNGPSSQLDHSLKISRQSCNKFTSPFGRSI